MTSNKSLKNCDHKALWTHEEPWFIFLDIFEITTQTNIVSKDCYNVSEPLGKVVWLATLAKTVSPYFVVIEKISIFCSGSFKRKEWKECISPKKIFIYRIYILASWIGYRILKTAW